MSLFEELKRRNVVRVAIGYLAGAWLLIQIFETLLPIFGLPETSARIIVILLAIGFVPALVISWYFEITPEGLVRDADAPKPKARDGRTFDRVVAGVLTIAVVYFAVDKFVLDPARDAELLEAAKQDAAGSLPADLSIAVLPFADLSPTGDQQYFSDGISEEMINLLAGIQELRVTSRSSAFQFRGDVDLREVSKKLRVAHVLEGSVRMAGDRIRITAQLIDARTDTHLWSQNFDRTLEDVFAIQDEIASEVVDNLKVRLLEPVRSDDVTTDEVHRLYLQALHIWNNGVATSYAVAEEMVTEALRKDPGYVPAWTLLARIYYVQGNRDLRPDGEDTWALVKATVDRARSIDPDHPFVLSWLAFIANDQDRDYQTSIEYTRRALAKMPSDETLLRTFANLARNIGRTEAALPIYDMLLARAPLCMRCYDSAFIAYIESGNFKRVIAEAALARSLGLDSNYIRKQAASAHLYLGNPEAALDELAGIDDIYPGNVQKLHGQAMAYYSLGRIDEARAAFDAAEEGINPCQEAQIAAWIGDVDDAFSRLTDYDATRCGLQFDPALRNMHDDPRWPALIEANRIPGSEELDFSLDFIADSGRP